MSGKSLALALALCGLAAIGVGTAVLFAGGAPPSPPRPKPAAAQAPNSEVLKFSATLYRGRIEHDAHQFGVEAPTPEVWAAPFPHFNEGKSSQRLRPGGSIQTRHLRLSLVIRREQGRVEGQSFRADHLALRIENATNRYLAYRITTRVPSPERCEAKGVIAQNAIGLAPHETVTRTECLFQNANGVEVVGIEVLEVPGLSYFYVSRLDPGLILYDLRSSAGHAPPKGAVCPQVFSWREIRDGADRGEIVWRDIVDFYARHNCDEFTFFPGYRYRDQAGLPLPARPTETDPGDFGQTQGRTVP